MCDDDYTGSWIPSVSSVAGGVLSGVVDLAMAGGPVMLGLVVVAAVASFVVTNAVLITAGVCVVGLGTLALVQFLKRFMVVVHDPPRAKAAQQVAVTRGHQLPRNLQITQGQPALPAPVEYHVHLHGVSPDDVAAIINRKEIRP